MLVNLADFFALLNDILQAIIIIFGSSVVLYNIGSGFRNQVTVAFSALVTFVCIVFLCELMASRIVDNLSIETWLRVQWVGIAFVPAAQFHLSDALLTKTGAAPKRRKFLTPAGYLISSIFLGLVLFSDLIVNELVEAPLSSHMRAGNLFALFAIYFWVITGASIYNVWRARRRCVTSTTRRRMSSTLVAFLAAPLGVFPYLLISGDATNSGIPAWLWPVIILGNVVVGVMFSVLTIHVSYFSTDSPDRVVWVRLVKFMARVPLTGSIVLLVYVLVSRGNQILGLETETMIGFSVVMTVMLVEWAIHTYKRPLERLFQLNDDPDVQRIQRLSERLLTTRDLRQFLESILAATCELLRTPTAFVAAITSEGPKLESVVGSIVGSDTMLQDADWRQFTRPVNGEGPGTETDIKSVGEFFLWQNFWIRPLFNADRDIVLGIMGVQARNATPNLTEYETNGFNQLILQAESALEDRVLQQEVFAAVEGLLPQITALQKRNQAATFGGLPTLTARDQESNALLQDPEFNSMVRDALSHYWGGPKLTTSPLIRLSVVRRAMGSHDNNAPKALRSILDRAIDLQKPEGERKMTTAEWILYNILELKFVQGFRVRDVARRLAMSESDLYRKQRVAIENVARTISTMEKEAVENPQTHVKDAGEP